MNEYITVRVSSDQTISNESILIVMDNLNIDYWFLHKEPGLRLRVNKIYTDKVMTNLPELKCHCTYTIYEPELDLFGGILTIDIIHDIFCQITKISRELSKLPQKEKDNIILYLINKIASYGKFDYFEEWDVWNKVCMHRQIDVGKNKEIILSKVYDVYKIINSKPDLYFSDDINTICKKIEQLVINLINISKNNVLDRGVRGILSSIIIFSMNILGVTPGKQAGFVHILKFIKNPDFREVF